MDRIPTFRPPWINKRTQRRRDERPSSHARGYGGRGWNLTRRQCFLRDNYQCQHCGQIVFGKSAHCDHIKPKAQGGSDLLSNVQTLCSTCHQIKTNKESVGKDYCSLRPTWIRKPNIPVTVVCGAPASGKSTYVAASKKKGDHIIDLDAIASKLAGSTEHTWSFDVLNKAIQQRNKMLDALADASHAKAWFIVCEPSAAHRGWWRDQLNAKTVVIETPAHVCEQRIAADKERARQIGNAEGWWQIYSRSPLDEVILG